MPRQLRAELRITKGLGRIAELLRELCQVVIDERCVCLACNAVEVPGENGDRTFVAARRAVVDCQLKVIVRAIAHAAIALVRFAPE